MEPREPDLSDYLRVLLRRARLLAAGVVVGLLVGFALAAVRPTQHLVQASISTYGLASGAVDNAISELDGSLYVNGSVRDRLEVEYVKPASVELRVRTHNPAQAAQSLRVAADKLVTVLQVAARQQVRLRASRRQAVIIGRDRLANERALLEKRVAFLDQELPRVRAMRDNAAPARDTISTLVFLRLSEDVSRYEAELGTAQRRLAVSLPAEMNDLTRQLEDIDAIAAPEPTPRIVAAPNPQGTPLGRWLTPIGVGLVLGGWGALLIIFVLEFLQQGRRKEILSRMAS
jgi:hypothetical protein